MRLYGIWAFGAGGLAAGLLGLFTNPGASSIRRLSFVAAAIILIGLGSASMFASSLAPVGPPMLALGGILLIFQFVQSDRIGGAIASYSSRLRQSRWQWAALAAGCPAIAGLMLLQGHAPEALPVEPMGPRPSIVEIPPLRMLPANSAQTDNGHDVTLWAAILPNRPEEDLSAAETYELNKDGVYAEVIRTAPPDRSYNCHGWIFTGNRCFIPDWTVDSIIEENGYKPVERPVVGDLVVYRNDQGAAFHSAIVRAVGEDGQIILESKWGWMGRYLHRPDKTPYGQKWQYYHSARHGHHLQTELNSTPKTTKPLSTTGR